MSAQFKIKKYMMEKLYKALSIILSLYISQIEKNSLGELPEKYKLIVEGKVNLNDFSDDEIMALLTDAMIFLKEYSKKTQMRINNAVGNGNTNFQLKDGIDSELFEVIISRDLISEDAELDDGNETYNFQARFTSTSKEYSTYGFAELQKIWPDIKGERIGAKITKRAISAVIIAASIISRKIHTYDQLCMSADPHMVTSGSKKSIARAQLKLENLKLNLAENATIAESFGRSGIITIKNMHHFTKAILGDINENFVNFYKILIKYPMAVTQGILRKLIDFGLYDEHGKPKYQKVNNEGESNAKYADEDKKAIKDKMKSIYNYAKDNMSAFYDDMKPIEKIDAAVNHYLLVNTSYDGCMESSSYNTNASIVRGYEKMQNDLMLASIALTNVIYEVADYKKTIKKIMNDPNALLIVDPPYLRLFLIGYKYEGNDFTTKDMKKLFDLLKRAKCKVVFFHSHNWRISTMCEAAGLKFGGSYYDGYATDVFTKNISEEEQIFIQKGL